MLLLRKVHVFYVVDNVHEALQQSPWRRTGTRPVPLLHRNFCSGIPCNLLQWEKNLPIHIAQTLLCFKQCCNYSFAFLSPPAICNDVREEMLFRGVECNVLCESTYRPLRLFEKPSPFPQTLWQIQDTLLVLTDRIPTCRQLSQPENCFAIKWIPSLRGSHMFVCKQWKLLLNIRRFGT